MFLSLFETLYNVDVWFGFMRLSYKLFLPQTFLDSLLGHHGKTGRGCSDTRFLVMPAVLGKWRFAQLNSLEETTKQRRRLARYSMNMTRGTEYPRIPSQETKGAPLGRSITTAVSLSSRETVGKRM